MAIAEVIAQVDAEIAKLQRAKAFLLGDEAPKHGRGRPKGSKNSATRKAHAASVGATSKRTLSPEGRKAIADAVKRRWSKQRTQTASE